MAGHPRGDEAGVVSAGEIVMLRHRLAVAEAERDEARAQRTLESARASSAERGLAAAQLEIERMKEWRREDEVARKVLVGASALSVGLIDSVMRERDEARADVATLTRWNEDKIREIAELRAKLGDVTP